MFERFTKQAIKVIMLAQEESRRLGHNFVGSEMILLGLIGEGTSLAATALKQAGVTKPAARAGVEKVIGRGTGFVAVEIPFTPRAKRVLEASWNFARKTDCNYIGPEHLLAGVLTEHESVAVRALYEISISLESVQTALDHVMGLPAGTVSHIPMTPPAEPEETKCELCDEMISSRAKICRHCQRPQGEHAKRCPICAEIIWQEAVSCRFCKAILSQ